MQIQWINSDNQAFGFTIESVGGGLSDGEHLGFLVEKATLAARPLAQLGSLKSLNARYSQKALVGRNGLSAAADLLEGEVSDSRKNRLKESNFPQERGSRVLLACISNRTLCR
jgi:hypothetical protein